MEDKIRTDNSYINKRAGAIEVSGSGPDTSFVGYSPANTPKINPVQAGNITDEEKITEIAKLVSGLAHHINNPMGFIKSNISTLVRYADVLTEGAQRLSALSEISRSGSAIRDDNIMEAVQWLNESKVNYICENIRPLISESLEGIDRISSVLQRLLIIDQVVRYANFVIIDLNRLIKSIDYSSEFSPSAGVSFRAAHCCYPLMVYGKVEQLRIAIESVLKNAVDAVGEQGEIKINTRLEDGFALLEIHDTGEGIPPGVITCVFEPFFSTKESINRVGMDLTISQYIIQAHGGRMKIRSGEGAGTCVSIWLPLHDLK
jgi:two-component system NtrC family sensor kinase